MYQGIAKVHSPNWFPEDKEKLEKVLLELWPNSKINPRKMFYYIENVKAFYPEIVHEALGKIVATQEYDRRPTINQLRKKCQELVRDKHQGKTGPSKSEDCPWCGYQQLVHVGLYIETPEKCQALDIQGKNVLMLHDGWAVRPDWGHELKLNLEEYMVHCPHCSHPKFIQGLRSALHWDKRFGVFTEFRCRSNGNTDRQWNRAYTLYHNMISPMRPEGDKDYEGRQKEEARFHEYLAKLPNMGDFEERKMNECKEEADQPAGSRLEWREEEAEQQRSQAEEGKILPPQDQGLPQGPGIPGGDSGENPEDSNER